MNSIRGHLEKQLGLSYAKGRLVSLDQFRLTGFDMVLSKGLGSRPRGIIETRTHTNSMNFTSNS